MLVPALGAILYFIVGRKQRVATEPGGAFKSAKMTAIIALVVTLPICGFVGLMVHTSMSQFNDYRVKGANAAASSDLRNAKTSVEVSFADNGKYPDTLPPSSDNSGKEAQLVSLNGSGLLIV